MKRRDFVKTAAAGAAAGSLLVGCGGDAPEGGAAPGVHTRPQVRWRLVSSYPRSLDTLYGAVEEIAARVDALTEGRFQIRPSPAGELVPANGVLTAVQNGTIQMGHSASYYYVGNNPALAFDTCVPFGLTARQQNAWLHQGGGLELMRGLFADFDVVNFPAGNTGAQMGGWFRRPVDALEDLRGLKMRIPGLGGEVMSRLGVTVQLLAGGEIYPALERGAIDATEWVGPYDDEKLGFHQIVRNYYYPGWWEPGPQLSFYINQGAWDGLPSAYRQALEVAAAEANETMLAAYDAKNAPALRRLVASGVQLRPFPDDVMREARRVTDEVLEAGASDPGYDRVYQAFKKWRDGAHQWFGTAEMAFASYAYGSLAP